jgi:hypothetical protein
MGFLSIDRPGGAAPQTLTKTNEATYLSPESLTFPGITGVAAIILGLVTRLSDGTPEDWVVVLVGLIIGGMLIALGLADPEGVDKTGYGKAVQLIIGLLNTAVLISALFGTVTIINSTT